MRECVCMHMISSKTHHIRKYDVCTDGVTTISRLLKLYVSFAEYHLFYRSLCKRDIYF